MSSIMYRQEKSPEIDNKFTMVVKEVVISNNSDP